MTMLTLRSIRSTSTPIRHASDISGTLKRHSRQSSAGWGKLVFQLEVNQRIAGIFMGGTKDYP